jgi:polyhydroxybutyrate depolymerase
MALFRHKRWLFVVGIVLGVAFVARIALWAAEPTTTLPPSPAPGTFTLVMKSGGYDRVAQIHVPATYKTGSKPPLVLLLHGGGGGATHALEKDGWAAKADKEGFLIVAPEGLGALPKLPTNFKINPALWNSGQLNARSPRAKIDDVAFIRELLDELQGKVPYDESRVFSTGHSNGGGMTFRLAAELSERFTAIGMVAGRMVIESPKPTRSLPTLYIIGTEDLLMPLKGGEVKSPWGSWLNPPVSEQLAKWAAAIGCEKEPKVISDKDDVRKVEYLSKTGGPTLTVIYIDGQGHHWPGGKAALPDSIMGPNTNKLNATDTIWEFFKTVSASTH